MPEFLELISFQSAFSKVFYSNELQRIEQNGDCIGSSFEATLIPSKRKREAKSAFDERTEESSAQTYFQFYGLLSQQQNMMQDYSRILKCFDHILKICIVRYLYLPKSYP